MCQSENKISIILSHISTTEAHLRIMLIFSQLYTSLKLHWCLIRWSQDSCSLNINSEVFELTMQGIKTNLSYIDLRPFFFAMPYKFCQISAHKLKSKYIEIFCLESQDSYIKSFLRISDQTHNSIAESDKVTHLRLNRLGQRESQFFYARTTHHLVRELK